MRDERGVRRDEERLTATDDEPGDGQVPQLEPSLSERIATVATTGRANEVGRHHHGSPRQTVGNDPAGK